jgi:hypothetical protein
MNELLLKLLQSLYSETPEQPATEPAPQPSDDVPHVQASPETPEIIEINPDAMYRLAGSNTDPVGGNSLWTERMLHKGFTEKSQQQASAMKALNESNEQYKLQVEQLNNQLLKLKLGNDFNQQQTAPGQGEPAQQKQETVPATDDTGYERWFAGTPETEPTTQHQGFNSTPNLDLNILAASLLQHPDFVSQMDKLVTDKAAKMVTERETKMQAEKEVADRNTQYENTLKQEIGDEAVNLFYAEQNALINEGDYAGAWEQRKAYNDIIAKRAIEQHEQQKEAEEKAAIEAAITGPIAITPVEGESPTATQNRKRQETLKHLALIGQRS